MDCPWYGRVSYQAKEASPISTSSRQTKSARQSWRPFPSRPSPVPLRRALWVLRLHALKNFLTRHDSFGDFL